ncbi:MAG: hypothetical protein ACOH2J_10545 [Allorhizobium sp.]
MENHGLGIGVLNTDCSVIAYPQAVAALRSTMDRALDGPFSAMLADAAEPVLAGHEGVIRIRNIRLDLAHSGPLDENSLADILASRLAAALRKALESRSSDVRSWPDHVAYMASYIDMRLGFAHEPAWAFPDFEALRLLSAVQATLEVVKARPAVLIVLALNGNRTGSVLRFVDRLDAASARHLMVDLLEHALAQFTGSSIAASPHLAGAVIDSLRKTTVAGADKRVLGLISEASLIAKQQDMPLLVLTAALAFAYAQIIAEFEHRHGRRPTHAELSSATDLASRILPPHLAAFANRMTARTSARLIVERLHRLLSDKPLQSRVLPIQNNLQGGKQKAKVLSLHSPLAGLALLLPDVVRLSLHRHLGVNGLRQALLSILDADTAARAQADALIDFLYPQSPEGADPTFPPVLETAIARLAAQSRGLITGRQAAAGWGDLLLASFASRLPGLRASSRPYLQRQFLVVSGQAEITNAAIVVTLDGPPLSIILKMAGLSGDQMPVPHLDDRRLILNLGGQR